MPDRNELLCPGCGSGSVVTVFEYTATFLRTIYGDGVLGGAEDETHGESRLKSLRCGEGCGWENKDAERFLKNLRRKARGSHGKSN